MCQRASQPPSQICGIPPQPMNGRGFLPTMNETPELKCCPFCGCPRVEYDTGAIECYQCAARGPAEIKVHVAAAEWNRRTTDAELAGLRAELAARDQLLAERVAFDEIAVLTEDGPMCHCCGALWEYDDDTPDVRPGTEWHNDGCWVLRARAALGVVAGGGGETSTSTDDSARPPV